MHIKRVLLTTGVAFSLLFLFSTTYALETTYTYDDSNRLTKVTRQDENETTIFEYTHDLAGNITSYKVSRTIQLGLGDLIKILQTLSGIDSPVDLSTIDLDRQGRLGLADALLLLQDLGEIRP
jgi:hypothetical protein